VDCLTIAKNADEAELREHLTAPAHNLEQALFVSGPLRQTGRVMVKDENVCLHCGLCAERCPTYAWDMRKFVLQQPYAGMTFIPLEAVGR
jgi:NAD-dependent dihydropyrimidine dehydrogenase PreA subunit